MNDLRTDLTAKEIIDETNINKKVQVCRLNVETNSFIFIKKLVTSPIYVISFIFSKNYITKH